MPLRTTTGGVKYHLINFDSFGAECADDKEASDGSGFYSRDVIEELRKANYTDVFLISHGWRGDRRAAVLQYDLWIDKMKAVAPDIGSRSLIIGLHWPSEPFGDEGESWLYQQAKESADGIVRVVDNWTKRLGVGTKKFIQSVQRVAEGALSDEPPSTVNHIRDAYRTVDSELQVNLRIGSNGNTPADDRLPFNPQLMTDLALKDYHQSVVSENEQVRNLAVWNSMLLPIRVLSVWTMKARAAMVGENGPRKLLAQLQEVTDGKKVRFHLSGHSFGTIVISAMAFGDNSSILVRPVNSIVLIQGAVSHWSYAGEIPYRQGVSGYFHAGYMLSRPKGPLVTTQSSEDRAVCVLYRLAAAAAEQIAMAENQLAPEYGAVGQFGIWDGQTAAPTQKIIHSNAAYNFMAGHIYNVDCSSVIKHGGGLSGAHNDIAHEEVARLVWQSALSTQ
jgi:hypothetical protein